MALKATVHEKCDRCGQRDARVEGNYVVTGHKCLNPVPGPGDFPRRMPLSSVNFVRGEWTTEELQAELDAAHQRIAELASERTKYRDQVERIRQIVN